MRLFDKLKRIVAGEKSTPPKNEKNISPNDLKKVLDENNKDYSQEPSLNNMVNNNSENLNIVKPKEQTIEEIYLKNEEEIFNNIIFSNLFNDDNKYSDYGIFNKSEPYLKIYFENYGYEWDLNRDKIFALYKKSGRLKVIVNYLEENYNYYITNRISFSWSGHFSEWLKIVIDKSITDKKCVTKQYARMIVGTYYYKDFVNKGTKDVLYKNLISMISAEEFKVWIINDATCFDNIIKKVEKRFKKQEINDVDERVLITQIVKSKLFRQALAEYPFIQDYATISKYSKIYKDAIHDTQVNSIDLNVKNVIEEKKIEEKPKGFIQESNKESKNKENGASSNISEDYIDTNEEKKVEEKPKESIQEINKESKNKENGVSSNISEDYIDTKNQILKEDNQTSLDIKEKKVKNNLTEGKTIESVKKNNVVITQDNAIVSDPVKEIVTKQNNENNIAPAKKSVRKTDDFDKALKKIGGNRNVENTPVINFLENIKSELIIIDESYDFKYDSIMGCSDVDFDEEIDNLLHY